MQNSNKDKLAKLLYEFNLASGTNIINVSNLTDAIEIGYNQNPDVFSIVNYLATLYNRVPKKPYKKGADGKFTEVTDPNTIALVNKANKHQTITEYDRERYIFYLITGNSFTYAPRLEAGNQAGQLTDIGRKNMPSQHVEIISGGWIEPIKEYVIDYNFNKPMAIPANEVIHCKMVNLNYINGENLYGISPIKVAATVIQAQNNAYKISSTTMGRGMPSGILSKEDETDTTYSEGQNRIEVFKRWWNKHFGKSSKNTGEPLITAGKVTWTPIGLSNFKDLQIIETSQEGRRVLCNIWGIPSITMNDISGTTFNNQSEVNKRIYTQRIMPDIAYFCEKDNQEIWSNYGFEVWPDYSQIEELQSNKKELADVLNVAQQAGALLSGKEIRDILDIDNPGDPALDVRFTQMGRTPVDDVINPTDPAITEALKRMGINNYIK